ncbi:type II toxin-antitoxin system HicA family toxin [Achromobacter dolens]|uniref:type II toxin-antitoxin system HicA family toxin n=1 Tax=Achromobacter dolens TaxID=1287738 RepID=UPI00158142D0|nr:type II toxin-antitoxin system HicA family toxin [Achromobacter dolens]
MNGYFEKIIAVLKEHGFSLVRQGKGAHQIWGKGGIHVAVSTGCKSRHTANAVMKEAGIKHHF